MMIIECPFCGPRNEMEFGYGGQAHVAYPEDPDSLTDEEWAQFLFYRDNPKGWYAERWLHAAGCRKWFNAVRDTRTYQIAQVYRLDEARPEVPAGVAGARNQAPRQPIGSPTAVASPERAIGSSTRSPSPPSTPNTQEARP